jgi:hypothetical protein
MSWKVSTTESIVSRVESQPVQAGVVGNDGRAESVERITHVGEGDPEPPGDFTLGAAQSGGNDRFAVNFSERHRRSLSSMCLIANGSPSSLPASAAIALQIRS